MRKIFILYENFYTADGESLSIGGIQTYIKSLIEVIKESKMVPVVYQFSNFNFKKNFQGTEIHGVAMKQSWGKKKKNKKLFESCKKIYNSNTDTIIFACETMSVKNEEPRVIGIQHGITWDKKGHENYSSSKNHLFVFWRALRAYNTVLRLRNIKVLVGVDYNFINWYRTQVAYIDKEVNIIPNYTRFKAELPDKQENLNIIFARRFHQYRGTRLFSSVLEEILCKYQDVEITFAGNGPDEAYLKEIFKGNENVNFITYVSEESLEIHEKHHIAVVPTIGSEGTSLSLLEAMASKCAVIATNVGGMTNIILDKYNGLLINPQEKDLFLALESLIIDKKLRNELAEKGYETVSKSFNQDKWKQEWRKVLENNYI